MASRHASSTYGMTPTVGGSTIVHSTTVAADEEQSPIDRDTHTRSPVDVSRYPTVYEQNGQEQRSAQQQQQAYSRPPSAQPRYSNPSRMGTYRVDSPSSELNYPSWLPRRPLAPQPPGSTDGGHSGNRASSAGGYYGGNGVGGRLAEFFNFSRGHSRNVTQSSNRVSTAMSGFITNPSDYGGPPGPRTTADSGGRQHRKETDGSGTTSYGQAYSPDQYHRRGSTGDYDAGRRPPSRSVRIAPGSVDHGRGQEPTDQTRRPSSSVGPGYGHAYGHTSGHHGYSHVPRFSRGAVNPYSAAMLSQSPLALEPPHPGTCFVLMKILTAINSNLW